MSSKLSDILKLFAWDKPQTIPSSISPSHKSNANSKRCKTLKPKVIKLNFRDICQIDSVSSAYHEIEELSLNHNYLQSLSGIDQFQNLRSLHLNFNQLRSTDEFLKIANPHLLKELSFKSNPRLEFQSNEHMIEFALSIFPNLQYLNGQHIQD